MYSPEHDMTREQVDEIAKTIIDKIVVVPVNSERMKLEICLKTGANSDIAYVANNRRSNRRSGHISYAFRHAM